MLHFLKFIREVCQCLRIARVHKVVWQPVVHLANEEDISGRIQPGATTVANRCRRRVALTRFVGRIGTSWRSTRNAGNAVHLPWRRATCEIHTAGINGSAERTEGRRLVTCPCRSQMRATPPSRKARGRSEEQTAPRRPPTRGTRRSHDVRRRHQPAAPQAIMRV
jgi:hypothetical protein